MSDFKWNDYIVPESQSKSEFNWEDHIVQNSPETAEQVQTQPVSTSVGPQTSATSAFVRGAAQGPTLGFGDEIIGGLDASKDVLLGDAQLSDFLNRYRKSRDAYRAADDLARKEHPYAFAGGNIVGGTPLMLIPGLNSIKALSALGAAQGLGSSTAELTPDKATSRDLVNAGKDAAIGGTIAAGLGWGANQLLGTTSGKALQAGLEGENLVGQAAIDAAENKVIDTGKSALKNLQDLLDSIGISKEQIVSESEAAINPQAVADRVRSEVIDPLRATAKNQPIANKVEAELQNFLNKYSPNYTPSTRPPGSPTTITRKLQFAEPQATEATIPFEEGLKSLDPKTVETAAGLVGKQVPVSAYVTPEAESTIIPGVKKLVEKRLEATPELPTMTPSQLDKELMAVKQNIEYAPGAAKAPTAAEENYARILKEETENAITNPYFKGTKEDYGTVANLKKLLTNEAPDEFGQIQNLTQLAEKANKPGVSGELVKRETEAALNKLRGIDPELADQIGNKLFGDVQKLNLANDINSFTPHSWRTLLNPLKSTSSRAANKVGLWGSAPVRAFDAYIPEVSKDVGELGIAALKSLQAQAGKPFVPDRQRGIGQPLAQQSNDISYATSNELMSQASNLRNNGYADEADRLEKAVQSGDNVRKEAILNGLLQNPTTRRLLKPE